MRLNAALRAAFALAAGIIITFSQQHGSETGLLALLIASVGWSLAAAVASVTLKDRVQKIVYVPLVVIHGFMGFLAMQPEATGQQNFMLLVTAWGILLGGYEILQAQMVGLKTRAGRDHTITAVLTLLVGGLFLAVPLDIVSAVGFFGAYLIIVGIHLGLAAFSPAKTDDSAK